MAKLLEDASSDVEGGSGSDSTSASEGLLGRPAGVRARWTPALLAGGLLAAAGLAAAAAVATVAVGGPSRLGQLAGQPLEHLIEEVSAAGKSRAPKAVPVKAPRVHFTDVSDAAYLKRLSEEKVYGGKSLLETTQNVTWPKAPWYSNSALWAFGDAASPNLYVWSVGTSAMCLQYADTLAAAAKEGYFVLCPAISHGFSIAEWVLKAVVAVEWALERHTYGKVVLGGHSGGGPVALGAGSTLAARAAPVAVAGYMLQHPGAVPFLNMPGCEAATKCAEGKEYCRRFFPSGMMSTLPGPVALTCGTFCQLRGAEYSNFGSETCSRARKGEACSSTWTSPRAAAGGAPDSITCKKGTCPDSSFLASPSDCMVSTLCEDVFAAFVKPALGGGLLYKHCGEHEWSVMGPYGLLQEGKPVVVPFLRAVAAQGALDLSEITGQNGVEQTCWERLAKIGDHGLSPVGGNTSTLAYMEQASEDIPWANATSHIQVELVPGAAVTAVTAAQ